jgi:para-nitrobenzyl esterase
MVACLRAKTPAEVIDAQAKSGVAWRPVVGGASQPLPPLQAFSSGTFNRVPFIMGNTRHETRAFVYEGNDLVRQPLTAQAYEATIRANYGANADRVLAQYPVSGYAAPGLALAAVQTDSGFACNSVPVSVRGNDSRELRRERRPRAGAVSGERLRRARAGPRGRADRLRVRL